MGAVETTFTTVAYRSVLIDGYETGALDIAVKGRRVLSIPSQLGCSVGCQFCISRKTPLVRNLTAKEMLQIVQTCLDVEPPDGRPVELSFTGEGEPLLNWKNTTVCTEDLTARYPGVFNSVRYCLSGIGAGQLLARATHSQLPVRLQFSLHTARQPVRDTLIPRSVPLDKVLAALLEHEAQFAAIELNVVLQNGVNDTDDDLRALADWGPARWPVLLNPMLAIGQAVVATETERFAAALRAAGRDVRVYRRVAERISRHQLYPLMTATT